MKRQSLSVKMDDTIQVKMDSGLKHRVENAARERGLSSSAWLRSLALIELGRDQDNKSPMPAPKKTADMPVIIRGVQNYDGPPEKRCTVCELNFLSSGTETVCLECVEPIKTKTARIEQAKKSTANHRETREEFCARTGAKMDDLK